MFEVLPVNETGTLAFKANGKLTSADYETFLPRLEDSLRRFAGRMKLGKDVDLEVQL